MAAESKNTFLDSLVKIGHGFYEIFGFFGNAIGDAFGLTVVKSGDKRSKVGEHFKTIGDGLTITKDKLNELSNKISEAKNADSSTIEAVKGVINSANDVFERLIAALTKLADTTKEAGNTDVGDARTDANAGADGADKISVEAIIKEVKAIIETSEKSGVQIEKGTAGNSVENGNGPKVLAGGNARANAGDAAKLADEVAKADPWAMINKIKDAKTKEGALSANANNDAGELATGTGAANVTAATNADLAAAVALKAMTKGGKFTQPAENEEGAVKAAAVTAVNKVLGVLNFIIRKTVSSNLDKIREAS
ncbi:Variable major protein (plasmid) [Borrelia parkeri SLO]|uniref:Variable large protein n=1 Tax=Borrelia parkeri SLO TaxID=1313294 RepID=W5SSF8_BORPR|nr:Variable major protein [Borrelia parkeri SLO]